MSDETKRRMKKLLKLNPDARCVYFPMEQEYAVWINYEQFSEMHQSKIQAINEAIKKLG